MLFALPDSRCQLFQTTSTFLMTLDPVPHPLKLRLSLATEGSCYLVCKQIHMYCISESWLAAKTSISVRGAP